MHISYVLYDLIWPVPGFLTLFLLAESSWLTSSFPGIVFCNAMPSGFSGLILHSPLPAQYDKQVSNFQKILY